MIIFILLFYSILFYSIPFLSRIPYLPYLTLILFSTPEYMVVSQKGSFDWYHLSAVYSVSLFSAAKIMQTQSKCKHFVHFFAKCGLFLCIFNGICRYLHQIWYYLQDFQLWLTCCFCARLLRFFRAEFVILWGINQTTPWTLPFLYVLL